MSFQDNLRAYRERIGLNAKDFAASIGVKYSTYASYENLGREPKYATLIKIAAALHVSIDDLIGYDEYERLAVQVTRAGFSIEKSSDGKTVKLTPGENILHFENNLSEIIKGAPVELSTDDFIYWARKSYETVIDSDSFRKQYTTNLITVYLNQYLKEIFSPQIPQMKKDLVKQAKKAPHKLHKRR